MILSNITLFFVVVYVIIELHIGISYEFYNDYQGLCPTITLSDYSLDQNRGRKFKR